MKNPKIFIIGGYGGHNWGDDAQLYNNVRLLKENGYNNIVIASPHPYIGQLCKCSTINAFQTIFPLKKKDDYTFVAKKFLKLYYTALDWNKEKHNLTINERAIIEELYTSDILFFSGSGTINTRHVWGLALVIMPILLAHAFNKIIILSGQGFSPLDNVHLQPLITYALNNTNKIILRDFNSGGKLLDKINVKKSKILIGVDDAFTTPAVNRSSLIIPPKTVSFNISHYLTENKIDILHNVAKKLKDEGYYPVFNYFQGEQALAEKCAKEEFPIISFKHPEEIAHFYKHVCATIGMRYHSFIFSLAGLTPVMNIYTNDYQKKKIIAIQQSTKLPYCMLDIKNVSEESIYNQFQKIINYQAPFLLKIHEQWTKRANLGVTWVKKYAQ